MLPDFLNSLFPSFSVFLALNLATIAAGIMRGFSGFGAALLMAPVYSLFMVPVDMLAIILLLNLATTLQLLRSALRNVRWRLVLALFIPAMLGIPIGLAFLHLIDPLVVRKIIAGAVVGLAALL